MYSILFARDKPHAEVGILKSSFTIKFLQFFYLANSSTTTTISGNSQHNYSAIPRQSLQFPGTPN